MNGGDHKRYRFIIFASNFSGMNIFYTPDIEGDIYILSEEESKHAIRVLRMVIGEEVQLVDGRGGFYEASIVDANPKRCKVEVRRKIEGYGKRPYYLHVAIGPTKLIDRYEWFLEKATEIGIDEITPLESFHSERRVVKQERSEKVVTAAVKQSLKAFHPAVNELRTFKELVQVPFGGKKLIAHCNPGKKVLLKDVVLPGEDVLLLVGPEGDFSVEEVELAETLGFISVSLGESRLRTETAGVFACGLVAYINM